MDPKIIIEDLEKELQEQRKLLQDKKFDEGIEACKILCERALSFYDNAETCYEMAKFYYAYGNAVLYKMENSAEIFGDVIEVQKEKDYLDEEEGLEEDDMEELKEEDEKKEDNQSKGNQHELQDVIIADETSKKEEQIELAPNSSTQENKLDNNKNNDQLEDFDQFQLAWESLDVARLSAAKKYESLKSSENFSKEEIEQVLKFLSRVILRFGDLECLRDNFEDALKEYIKALEVRQIFDDPNMSRDLSELHFLIGNTYLYLGKDDCEDKALQAYNESKTIFENALKFKLGQLETNDIFGSSETENNKNLLNSLSNDDAETLELRQVLKMIYEKIEDTQQQKSEKEKFNIEQEKMKRTALEENKFGLSTFQDQPKIIENKENSQIPKEVKIIDLGVMGNARKRAYPDKEILNNDKANDKGQNEDNKQNGIKREHEFDHQEKRLKLD